mmetsp:Transcript_63146/g.203567  ORF Transcript_63146/g.203567 Transcript_63146/m.203567 type:complete len:252 (-) Transcript_63146:725-1480(-)
MWQKVARAATSAAIFLSSQGRPVRRSRRSSTTWVLGWLGKTMAAVCRARSRGETRTRVGMEMPLAISLFISAWASKAIALPFGERGASLKASSRKTSFMALSTSDLTSALPSAKPLPEASSWACFLASRSRMLCRASPWRTSTKVFGTACASLLGLMSLVSPMHAGSSSSDGRKGRPSDMASAPTIQPQPNSSWAEGLLAASGASSRPTKSLPSAETAGQGSASRSSGRLCASCSSGSVGPLKGKEPLSMR